MFISCSILGGLRSSSSPEKTLANMIRAMVHVKNAGYETIELWYSNYPNWVRGTIQEALDDLSLQAYSIHLPKFLASFDEKEFEDAVRSSYELIETLGLKVAVLHLPEQDQLTSTRWAKRYEMLLNKAEDADCMLTLENVPYIKDVDLYIRDEIEKHNNRSLGITIDMEFMHLNGSDIKWLVTTFGDRIVNIHFRDSDGRLLGDDGRRHYLIPGDGDIDLPSTVKTLHNSGYRGPLTIEVSHRQKENIIRAKQYAEDCLSRL
ncbi:MAG: sugar phosphate isomerase/epimerase [Candidatus Thorarchaeota archaeon]|nr:MAG: sugar phosphate isomerase/epimerase [Candidatus Thorarchaeota archaeon]